MFPLNCSVPQISTSLHTPKSMSHKKIHISAEATAQGLSTCILGWLNDAKIRKTCNLDRPVRLVIALGYAKEDDPLRTKKRKDMDELITWL